jgi:hypothetical protein
VTGAAEPAPRCSALDAGNLRIRPRVTLAKLHVPTITSGDLLVLAALSRQRYPTEVSSHMGSSVAPTQSALQKRTGYSEQEASNRLDHLIRLGLVERYRTDDRKYRERLKSWQGRCTSTPSRPRASVCSTWFSQRPCDISYHLR